MSRSKSGDGVGALLIQGMREALAHKRGAEVDAHVTTAKVTVRKVDGPGLGARSETAV